jgi:3-phosphoshikimate 1-carboxyvinyltransferase
MLTITHQSKIIQTQIDLPASKSISNRLLIIQYLMKQPFIIQNLSNCEDTQNLKQAIASIKAGVYEEKANPQIIDIGEAGTSYRFLTALLAVIPGKFILTGSAKLLERPILPLVNALNQLGAHIKFKGNNHTGPLLIEEGEITGGEISLEADISSQFITALMLVAPYFKNGLTIHLKGKIVSSAYLHLTMAIMKNFGANITLSEGTICIQNQPYVALVNHYYVESDWTAASYWYAMAVLSKESKIFLKGLQKNSLQGDSVAASLFSIYGIKSEFFDEGVLITKTAHQGFIHIFDFIDQPDLVQTFSFLNAALKQPLHVNNAANLIYKETNRIEALRKELFKIGVNLRWSNNDHFVLEPGQIDDPLNLEFETYNDHRMAMAASILAINFSDIKIQHPEVVAKSYPDYWNHMSGAGFKITKSLS